jgi:hypothetical protein
MLLRLIVITVGLLSQLGAAEKWSRYDSEHFELLTDGGKGRALEILEQFERVRWFFGTTMQIGDPPRKPRIVVFNTEKRFQAYAPRATAAAFYIGLPFRDYIAIGPTGEGQTRRTAVHEYIHLLVKNSETSLPVWMNEGLAELYSTIDEIGGKIRVGNVIDNHLFLLNNDWLELRRIVAADHQSVEYNKREHVGLFYSASWGLMHMLQLEPELRPRFGKFNELIMTGTPAGEAFGTAYGMTVEQMEARLKAYVRGRSVRVALFDLKFDKAKFRLEPTPASAFDVEMAMADLSMAKRDCATAVAAADSVSARYPEAPEPHVTKGYCAWGWGEKSQEKAATEFLAAAKKGTKVPEVYRAALGLMSPEMRRQEGLPILEGALRLTPDSHELVLALSGELLQRKEYERSFQELKRLKSIRRAEVDQYFPIYIQAAWFTDRQPAAQTAALQYERAAASEVAKIRAKQLKAFADYVKRKEEMPVPVYVPPTPESGAETLGEPEPMRFVGPKAVGKFAEFQCKEGELKVVLEVGAERQEYLIEDPLKVIIEGGEQGKTVELHCGKQKGEALEIQYFTDEARAKGARGLIQTMKFPEAK